MNSDSSLYVSTKLYMTVTCVTVLLSAITAVYVTQTITLWELGLYGYFIS